MAVMRKQRGGKVATTSSTTLLNVSITLLVVIYALAIYLHEQISKVINNY